MRRQLLGFIVVRLLGAGLQAVLGVLLARSLEPSVYGLVASVLGVLVVWFVVCGIGVGSMLSRARAREDDDIVRAGIALNLTTTLVGVLVAIGVVLATLSSNQAAVWLCFLAISQGIEKNTEGTIGISLADGAVGPVILSVLIRRVGAVLIFLGLLIAGTTVLAAYALCLVLAGLAGQVYSTAWLWSRSSLPSLSDYRNVPDALRRAIPFAANDIAVQSRALDAFVVAGLVGSGAAGYYAAAGKLASPFELAGSSSAAVLLPYVTRRSAGASALTRRLILLALACTPLAIGLGVLASTFIGPILGDQYVGAAPIVWVVVGCLPISVLLNPLSSILQGAGRARYVAVSSLIVAPLVLVGVALGALTGGATGAAVGLVVAVVVRVAVLAAGARSL